MIQSIDIEGIKRASREAGSHWFEPGAKRFFRSRVATFAYRGPGGTYFISSERPPNGARRYTVRRFDPSKPESIDTIGEFCQLSRSQAHREARACAQGGPSAFGGGF